MAYKINLSNDHHQKENTTQLWKTMQPNWCSELFNFLLTYSFLAFARSFVLKCSQNWATWSISRQTFQCFPVLEPDISFACTRSRSISGAMRPQVSYRGDGFGVESDPRRRNTFSCSTNSLETRNPSNFFLRFFNHIICRKKYFLSLVLGQYWWLSNLKENMWVGPIQSCRLHNWVWSALTAD